MQQRSIYISLTLSGSHLGDRKGADTEGKPKAQEKKWF